MTFSFIIPTSGRKTIIQTINSLNGQISSNDEILVVQDPGMDILSIIKDKINIPIKTITDTTPGNNKWGYKARTYGMFCATKEWIHIIGDDDIYIQGSIQKLRSLVSSCDKVPIICRMKRGGNEADTIWKAPVFGYKEAQLGGEMYVFPNIKDKFGRFATSYINEKTPVHYCGDAQFISELVSNYNKKVIWSNIIICHWRA